MSAASFALYGYTNTRVGTNACVVPTPSCEHDIDECEAAPCENGGTCWDEPGGFRCECGDEWRGERCERPRVRTCAHRPCAPEPRARCTDVPGESLCVTLFNCCVYTVRDVITCGVVLQTR